MLEMYIQEIMVVVYTLIVGICAYYIGVGRTEREYEERDVRMENTILKDYIEEELF